MLPDKSSFIIVDFEPSINRGDLRNKKSTIAEGENLLLMIFSIVSLIAEGIGSGRTN